MSSGHGETQANKERVIQGQQDTELSGKGIQQAQLTGIRLQQEVFTHAFSSDLERSFRTCELILEKNTASTCPIVKDPRLRERKFGIYEGRPTIEFQDAARKNRKSEDFPPGGETAKQLKARAREFFKDLCEKLAELEIEGGLSSATKRRRHTGSVGSDVFPVLEGGLPDNTGLCLNIGSTASTAPADSKLSPTTTKDSGHSSSGSTSSTSGCESLTTGSSLEQLSERAAAAPPQHADSFSAEPTSDISPSQESSCSSIDDSPSEPVICMVYDSEIQNSITAPPPQSMQYGCPNVSLSPIFEHRLSSISSISSGRNNSFDEGDCPPFVLAEVLVVSHGGWIQQLLTLLVDELGCKIPGGKKYALQISPNTGLSKFTCTLDPGLEHPAVTCLCIHDKDHLASLDVRPLEQPGET